MSNTRKLLLGIALGFIGYVAYTKLKKTQTVLVNSIDTPISSVIDMSTVAGALY